MVESSYLNTSYDILFSDALAPVGAVTQAAWKVRDRGIKPHSGPHVLRKQNVSSPLTLKDYTLWGALRDREVACSASNRQGSNVESCV